MSSKVISPTARLLRGSRLFSLPSPLPRPNEDNTGGGPRVSDSATLPYPVQQAIASPSSSRARGDWGLKRSLPLRSTTKSSTPVLRINAVDTLEHITDFDSAADLTLTLEKFQDLDLPLTTNERRTRQSTSSPTNSVFERDSDNTNSLVENSSTTRWKYEGPWTVGMTPGEFNNYRDREIRRRKPEFMVLLRARFLAKAESDERSAARHAGREPLKVKFEEEEFSAWIKSLRDSFNLASELNMLIIDFLDLPSLLSTSQRWGTRNAATNLHALASEDAPLKTHPSAGLSYLRTDAFLINHPIYGPQERHPPVEARVLNSSQSSTNLRSDFGSKIGIAGFVGRYSGIDNGPNQRLRVMETTPDAGDLLAKEDERGTNMGVGTEGGNRIWVEPHRANVDEHGRINIYIKNANASNVDIHTGNIKLPLAVTPPQQTYRYRNEEQLDLITANKHARGRDTQFRQNLINLAMESPY